MALGYSWQRLNCASLENVILESDKYLVRYEDRCRIDRFG